MGRVQGKVAIVTGAASGQGAAEAILLAREGASVVATDVDMAGLERTLDEINSSGGKAIALKHDVSKKSEWAEVVAKAEAEYGDITILVNNAGIWSATSYDELSYEEWQRVMDINAWSQFAGIQSVLPSMRRAGVGSIVNVASLAAVNACGRLSAYTASKGAIDAFSRAAAIELAPFNIRVNCVNPGLILTAMVEGAFTDDTLDVAAKAQPLRRVGRPEDVAYLVLYLASDEAWFTTGTSQIIDGGLSVMGGVAPPLEGD